MVALTLLGGTAGVAQSAPRPTPDIPPASEFEVDRTLEPHAHGRSIATIAGPDGEQLDFHADELLVASGRTSVVDALSERLNGRVTAKIAPGRLAKRGLKPTYVVRVRPSGGEASALGAALDRLGAPAHGKFRVSSQQGLDLLAMAAKESARGLDVGLNYLLPPTSIRTRSTMEALDDRSGGSYTANAFTWPGFSAAGLPAGNVGEAWNLLARAGRLPSTASRVPIAILDVGFAALDSDMPSSSIGATPRMNTAQPCGGVPGSCPWHGTNVASAAVALPDNRWGAAGTGGPVARAIEIDRGDDIAGVMTAVASTAAVAGTAHIYNMSFGLPMPAGLAWTLAPGDAALVALKETGALLFAAAGNSEADVDERDLLWESTYWWPCEAAVVSCVGGTGFASDSHDPESNFGSARSGDTVDLWAPYDAAVGPDPAVPGNILQRVRGTSVSAPHVAGVAALVAAANPALSGRQIEDILVGTARPGTGMAFRVVDALAAVTRALEPDLPPDIRITSPRTGTTLQAFPDARVRLAAFATDREDGTPTVRWTIDGRGSVNGVPIPTGSSVTVRLSDLTLGRHVVRAFAVDRAGHVVDDGVNGVTFTIVVPYVCLPPLC